MRNKFYLIPRRRHSHLLAIAGTKFNRAGLMIKSGEERIHSYLDKWFARFEEVLFTLWLGSLLEPVDYRLVRYAIFVVQNLKKNRAIGAPPQSRSPISAEETPRTLRIWGKALMIRVSS
jgi:hypothetical protein